MGLQVRCYKTRGLKSKKVIQQGGVKGLTPISKFIPQRKVKQLSEKNKQFLSSLGFKVKNHE